MNKFIFLKKKLKLIKIKSTNKYFLFLYLIKDIILKKKKYFTYLIIFEITYN